MNFDKLLIRVWCCKNTITPAELSRIESDPRYSIELSYLENVLNYCGMLSTYRESGFTQDQIHSFVKCYYQSMLFV